MAILQHYGISTAGFGALRPDAYEKCLAAVSVADLGRVYEALLDPGLGLAEVREQCPVWPPSSRLAGKLPSLMTLRDIKERILLDWRVKDRASQGDMIERLEGASKLSDEQYFQAMMRLLGDELFSAKLDGVPIMENLRVFDRLLRVWTMLSKRHHLTKREELSEKVMTLRRQEQEWKREKSEHRMTNDEVKKTQVPAKQSQIPKTNIQAPQKIQATKVQTVKAKEANVPGKLNKELMALLPPLDLGLGQTKHLSFKGGKELEASIKSMADNILAGMPS